MDGNSIVSVGIPTYNRPVGLRRTLECIVGQTYKNLEIIVSDNCSPEAETKAIIQEFMTRDSRIQYFKQKENQGLFANFQFVLGKATGEYFMWAADDDEWEPRFAEICLTRIGSAGSIMTGFRALYRTSLKAVVAVLPSLSEDNSVFSNACNFLTIVQPALFYGLHRRETIQFVLNEPSYDFYDCYFILRQILNHGYNTIGEVLYTAGIDANVYVKKPYRPAPKQLLDYNPFFWRTAYTILTSKRLSSCEQGLLLNKLASTTLAFFNHERDVNSPLMFQCRYRKFELLLRFRVWGLSLWGLSLFRYFPGLKGYAC